MMKKLIMLFLLGWYLEQVYGHQSSQTGYEVNNEYVPAAREAYDDKLPSNQIHIPHDQAQDERTLAHNFMASGINMTENGRDLENNLSLSEMPITVQTTTSTATPDWNSTGSKRKMGESKDMLPTLKNGIILTSLEESDKSINKDVNETQDVSLVHEENNSRTEGYPLTTERITIEEHLHTSHSLQTISDFEEKEDSAWANHRTSRKNDLCSACLCNPQKKDVFCKHEHVYDGKSHHLTLKREHIPSTATSLHIKDFERVTITNGTFSSEDLELREIKFENIEILEFYKESLYFNSKAKDNRKVAVVFLRCNIKEFPVETLTQYSAREDQINDIYLEETRSITLHIERCNISVIRSYAFFQARLASFKMVHTKVDILEENCIHLDIYEEWIVKYCQLPKLIQQAISVRTQKAVIFSHNTIRGLENRSLDILSSNQVLFANNYVSHMGSEALLGIRPYENALGANIVFLNNTVVEAEERSLVTNRRYLRHERQVLNNKLNIVCNCNIKHTFQHLLGISNKSDHHDQASYHAVTEKFWCQRFEDIAVYTNAENYHYENCTPVPIPIIASATFVIIVIIITIIVGVVCTQRAKKAKEEANYLGECCYSHSFSTLHSNPGPLTSHVHQCNSSESGSYVQPWVVAVPEVKTYQETEVDVHYEHTEPMKINFREKNFPEPRSDFQRIGKIRASYPFN
ncbi:uncharacterized protein [Panulirus ornatus]|uniref:uncharacterized protein n=1 Tax=Panulirus ornatus TaxID=150431 RepID=UPI003A8A3785